MKRAILLLALLIAAIPALAQYKGLPPEVQQNLGAIKKYPKASTILLWAKETYTLGTDGSQTYEWHSYRYLPDEASRDIWGDPRVSYDDSRQKLDVITARTYTNDGRTIDITPANAENAIVPDGLDKAPDYSTFREMVITLLGLENGCISELHYKLTTAKPIFPWLEGRVYFREEGPVISREVVVAIPTGQTLTYKADRGAPEPAVSGSTYTWKAGEQAGYDKEDLVGHRIFVPNVAFTTAKDWPEIQNSLKARVDTAIAGEIELPASLQKALTGISGDENRLEAIQGWVKERSNLLEFENPDFMWQLRSASSILHGGYGNRIEMAALVSKLAARAGVATEIVPVMTPPSPVPFLHEVSRAVLALRMPGGAVLYCDPLEPGSEFSGADLMGGWMLPLNSKTAPFEYAPKAKSPSYELSVALDKLDADTLKGHGTLSVQGEWGVYEAVRADGAEEYLKSHIDLNGLTITKSTVRDLDAPRLGGSVTISFDFDSKTALDTVDGNRILSLALLDFGMLTKEAPLALAKREFNQDVPMPGQISLHVECAIPDGWQAMQMPKSGTRTWDFDEGRIKCEVKDGRFIFERSLKLSKEWIPPESWSAYRAFVLESRAHPRNAVVFSTK
jgi:hypothetical protein